MNKLQQLRKEIKKHKGVGFVIPSNDEFQSEYCPDSAKRLEYLTGFSGSNGIAIVLNDKAAFFTDGRYTIQAKAQVSSKDYEIYNLADKNPWQWLLENTKKGKLLLDPMLHTQSNYKKYESVCAVKSVNENLIDLIWQGRPKKPQSRVQPHALKYAGESVDSKLEKITDKIKGEGGDSAIIAAPDSVCWLLNIRGDDVACSPLILAYAIVNKKGRIKLFIEKDRLSSQATEHLGDKIEIINPAKLASEVKALKGRVLIDPNSAPYWFFDKIAEKNTIYAADICQLPKACKNKVEIKGAYKAHIIDGVAVTKFLFWLDKVIGKEPVSEISASNRLLEFRQEAKEFQQPSFDTISGFGSNGAIVHYHSTEATNKELKGNGLFLLDSGGQYKEGTTDITRTIAIGKPTKEQKRNFTLVLKGHIALASMVFPEGITGSQLDSMARQYLWQNGLDFDHGTGHGVGSYLGVHEGPQRISKMPNNVALRPGMIISNEPGYYKEGEYGIRIENLITVIKKDEFSKNDKEFYGFETLTVVPIDLKLIDISILDKVEINWLNDYHKRVLSDIKHGLDSDLQKWYKESFLSW